MATLVRDMLPELVERLRVVKPYWSEIAHLANVSYVTLEGIVKGRPKGMNPRYLTMLSITEALDVIEHRHQQRAE